MEFTSILDAREISEKDKLKRAAFYEDLNLDQLIEVIARRNVLYDVRDYFYYFPDNEVCENYRREIYQDIKKTPVNEGLKDFCKYMYSAREKLSNKGKVNLIIQQRAWHVVAASDYCEALLTLRRTLEAPGELSHAMGKLLLYVESVTNTELFHKMKRDADKVRAEIAGLHFVVTIENERINVVKSEGASTYENFLKSVDENDKRPLDNPFNKGYSASMLEKAMLQVLAKSSPEIFSAINKFNDEFPEFVDKTFTRLEQELQFYLTFYDFQQQMQDAGFAFSTASRSENGEFQADGIYDLMLAFSNHNYNKPTIDNDVKYNENERFLIVSGPNQGGKTTFARSLGQMIFFNKLGLDVPAKSATLPYYARILTHFSVEESVETGCGKLKEELIRLQPMMEKEVEQAFVVINELFTTAANYDAYIMGQRVLEHFINQGCYGVYVTHIKELAKDENQIVSLRAMLDESDYHKRTYKIVRKYEDDGGHAGDIAEKYNLSYDQLKLRLANNSR